MVVWVSLSIKIVISEAALVRNHLLVMFYYPGANINAQTEETQETALTLACCGGFLEVADFLIKAGADIELGCSTPLMEAAQEGHLELVKYLLAAGNKLQILRNTCFSVCLFVPTQFPLFFPIRSKCSCHHSNRRHSIDLCV